MINNMYEKRRIEKKNKKQKWQQDKKEDNIVSELKKEKWENSV